MKKNEGGPLVFVWKVSSSWQTVFFSSYGDNRPWKVKQEDDKTVAVRKTANETQKPQTSRESPPVEAMGRG
jgi:hypothetical protein